MSPIVSLQVSPKGNDANPGTLGRPLQSLAGAQRAARKYRGRPVVVEFSAGIYRLNHTVVFTTQDSGNVTYQAKPGAEVTFTGSVAFTPHWSPYKGKILECQVPKGFHTDQIFINGQKQTLARYPNADPTVRIFNGYAKDAIAPYRVAHWANPVGGYVHAMHPYMWGDMHYRILGKDAHDELQLEGGWQNNRQAGMHPEYRYVEGIFEELDAPGEWFLDAKAAKLFYIPHPGQDLAHCQVEGPQLERLIEFRGAHGIKLRGFTFRHTLRTFMENREPLLRSDWTIARTGALFFAGTADCSVEDSTFQELGGNAVFVSGKNRHLAFRRCVLRDIGSNGFAFVGSSKAVRSPLFEYGQRQTYAQIDKTPGPKTDDYPMECLVEDCLITNTGQVEKQTAPVEISMSRRITVRHCSIYHVPRAGINIGDGCWGGHVIEGCDVFDTVLETGDHGSFNSWGRDRYWGLTDVDMNKGQRPDLAALDMIEPNTLRNNRWRCDHGWDIDLDDGSSRYIIENNLCLNGGLKNREGFQRMVENNIIVDNSFHPHVWFANSGDVFIRNIVFTPYRPIEVKKPWGKQVDFNFLQAAGQPVSPARELAEQSGRDEDSLTGDALFVNAAKGDFRVASNSPALTLGFKNFPMSDFGVRPQRLRLLARTPEISAALPPVTSTTSATDWQGAQIRNLTDPALQSAAGIGADQGVLVVGVLPGTAASRNGLQPLDVIELIDDIRVKSVDQLLRAVKNRKIRVITVWRNQKLTELKVD